MEVVAYHGTRRKFDSFSILYMGANENGMYGNGFYFSNKIEFAKFYTTLNDGNSPRILKVILSFNNPINIKSLKSFRENIPIGKYSNYRDWLIENDIDAVMDNFGQIMVLHSDQIKIIETIEL